MRCTKTLTGTKSKQKPNHYMHQTCTGTTKQTKMVPVQVWWLWPHKTLTCTKKSKQETQRNFIKPAFTVTSSIASIGWRNCNSDCLLAAARPCTFGFHKVQKWLFSLLLLMNLPTRLCRIRYRMTNRKCVQILLQPALHLLNLLILMLLMLER